MYQVTSCSCFLQNGRSKIQITFPQVRVQVTMIQIIEQHWKCLLALISEQSAPLDRGESVWFGYLLMEQWPVLLTGGIWPILETRHLQEYPKPKFMTHLQKKKIEHWRLKKCWPPTQKLQLYYQKILMTSCGHIQFSSVFMYFIYILNFTWTKEPRFWL